MSNNKHQHWKLKVGLVVIPFLLAAIYFFFFAVDRYVSTAQVVVRQEGSNPSAQMPGIAMLLAGANPASREETLYLREYITSHDMMNILEARHHWVEHFSAQRTDFYHWLPEDAPQEYLIKFYRRMISAHYDETTGLLTVGVQAYTPEMSKRLLETILETSEHFVNEVSHGIAREQMDFAKSELDISRKNYTTQKELLLSFQNDNKVLDGKISAQGRAGIIATLESEYSKQQAITTEMAYKLQPNAPQVQQQKLKVNAIRAQLSAEKRLLVSAPDGDQANVVASSYSQLVLDTSIAEETYKTSVAALDNARIEASKKIRTLVTVVTPNTPELPLYPERLYNIITILLGLLMLYGITRFLIASIEDHRD